MTVTSLSSDELIRTAEECFSLGMISQATLANITERASSDPSYNAILDLPFQWEIEHERELRRKAAHRSLRHRIIKALRP